MSNLVVIGTVSAPVTSYKLHSHGQWELVYYTGGEGIFSVENKEYAFESGDLFLIPPGTLHADRSREGYTNLYAYILSTSLETNRIVKVRDTPARDIYNLLLMVQREYYGHQESHAKIISSLLDTILCFIDVVGCEKPKNRYVEDMKQLIIEKACDASFSVGDIYDRLHINQDYARRLFLRETGTTPVAYLKEQRVQQAKALLEDKQTPFNIKEVALQCGFSDPYYFSRLFKQETGLSPKQWRSSHTHS